jgi:hypothetical protein
VRVCARRRGTVPLPEALVGTNVETRVSRQVVAVLMETSTDMTPTRSVPAKKVDVGNVGERPTARTKSKVEV